MLATTMANAENRQLIFFVFVLEFEQTRGNYAVTWMVVKSLRNQCTAETSDRVYCKV